MDCQIMIQSIFTTIAILASGALIPGCRPAYEPQPSQILIQVPFAFGVDQCARKGTPVSARQLAAFAGDPDLIVPWTQIEATFRNHGEFNEVSIGRAMHDMRHKYAFNQNAVDVVMPMDRVEAWFYMWEKPGQGIVSGVSGGTSISKHSVVVLMENENVIGICLVSYEAE